MAHDVEVDAAVAAATSGWVGEQIERATVGAVDAALNERVSRAVLHDVDEALTMPGIGAVHRALDPMRSETDDAVRAALDRATQRPV